MLNRDVIDHIFSYLHVLKIRTLNREYNETAKESFCQKYPCLYSILHQRWLPVIKQRIYYRLLLNRTRLEYIEKKIEEIPEWIRLEELMIQIRDELYHLNRKKQKLILEYRLFHKLQEK